MNAYSVGIGVEEFWRITPHEIALRSRAVGKEMERYQYVAAWHLCYILNMFQKSGAQPITPDKLLGKIQIVSSKEHLLDIRKNSFRKLIGLEIENNEG